MCADRGKGTWSGPFRVPIDRILRSRVRSLLSAFVSEERQKTLFGMGPRRGSRMRCLAGFDWLEALGLYTVVRRGTPRFVSSLFCVLLELVPEFVSDA